MDNPETREIQEKSDQYESQYLALKKEFKDFIEATRRNDDLRKKELQADQAKKLLLLADSLCRMTRARDKKICGEIDKVHENYLLNIEGLYQQLLSSSGLTPINPAPGTTFDDSFHMAIGLEYNSIYPEDTIFSVIRRGYTREHVIIRPAEVIISKKTRGAVPAVNPGFFSHLKTRLFSSQKRFETLNNQIDQLAHNESEHVIRLEKELKVIKESMAQYEEEKHDLNNIITEQAELLEKLEKDSDQVKEELLRITRKIVEIEEKAKEEKNHLNYDDWYQENRYPSSPSLPDYKQY